MKDLLKEFQAGSTRALAKLISAAENQEPSLLPALATLYETCGKAPVIGLTGVPGSGKSTLINYFVKYLRKQNKRVAVVAVDPVSPFTGGSLLGDRIRLTDHFNDDNVFIRSLSTRGKLGGLSLASREVIHLVSAFGFDVILVETVGVGQSEVDVRNIADVTSVILGPESGDSVQSIKAGILEIADLFVVHKADKEGADRVAQDLKNMLQMSQGKDRPLYLTTTSKEDSLNAYFDGVFEFLGSHKDKVAERRKAGIEETAAALLEAWIVHEAKDWTEKKAKGQKNPYRVLESLKKQHPPGSLFE